MPGRIPRRKVTAVTAGTTRQSAPPAQDLAGSNPERLRETVFNALRALPPDERGRLRNNILSDLGRAGVNIMSGLVKLGIMVETPDELSPSDVAKLVRYVRINSPEAMKIAGASLSELIVAGEQAVEGRRPGKKAA